MKLVLLTLILPLVVFASESVYAKDAQDDVAIAAFNAYRVRCGLRPCVLDNNLQNIAQNHSNEMYRRQRMYHSGTAGVAENVYMGSSQGAHAVQAWINSPPHRANMTGPYTKVGIAHTGGFYTMVLAR